MPWCRYVELNRIEEKMISGSKYVDEFYASLPYSEGQKISKRDATK